MANQVASPRLTPKFIEALGYAARKHAMQTRKASEVPYLGHLLSVAGLVIEADGTETQAIAALLHDAAEDQGGERTLAEIDEKFGAGVASIVAECSDTFETPKPPWHARKERYIDHLRVASEGAVLVSLADKLDNARAILRDFRALENEVWQRFSVQDPQLHLWYYRSLLEVFGQRTHSWMVGELRDVIDTLEQAVNRQSAQPNGGKMDTWDAICARRNVRQYTPEPVSEADLNRIAEAGWRAPSAKNRQPWDFVIVTDKAQLQELSTVWRGAGHIAGAAAAIVLVVPEPPDDRRLVTDQYDVGQATMAMMIAATDLGIGTGHSSVGDQDKARAILGVPDDHLAAFMLGIGYPADRPLRPIRKPDRRPFDEVVHRGRW